MVLQINNQPLEANPDVLPQGEDWVAPKFNLRSDIYDTRHHRCDPLPFLLRLECAVQHQQDRSLLRPYDNTPQSRGPSILGSF